MRFLASNQKKYSVLFIADDIFNDTVTFKNNPDLELHFTHEFPSINKKKDYGFRIYLADQDPTEIAKIYRNYIIEKGEFKSLAQKAKENPNVKKLYGAPFIYLWNNGVLTDADVHWPNLRKQLDDPFFHYVKERLDKYTTDGGSEFGQVIAAASKQDYVDQYQKNTILHALNTALKLKQFYNKKQFPYLDREAQRLVDKGISQLSEQELYTLNKHLLKSALSTSVTDVDSWGASNSTDILKEMKQEGIDHAWIGLPNWVNGLMNPKAVSSANQEGYLIGPYDSYHSIQKETNIDWNTANFGDPTLYDQATITNKNGEKIKGFLGRGRKLNPTLTMPAVKHRVNGILQNGILFNSWFVDCDATGEIYDDYTPSHITTEEQDLQARLARMNYIAKDKNMVVGSEGGNDFASPVIDFAHGIETPVIAWGDPDMRENKQSPYYVGGYWSAGDGVPDRYSKQVPVKDEYKPIYIDPTYSIPLFKLVYNDSVITSHHWEWGSLKIKGETGNRMLSELLYDVPPLYHLDEESWKANKENIVRYMKVWAPFHQQAVQQEMTSFKLLSHDRQVQETTFGKDIRVIANFSTHNFSYKNETIPAKSAIIYTGNQKQVFHAADYANW
ncbi:glycoside hydrolase [Fictibacillus sp. Mic-4]